ncbi:MAG: hypothetical protein ACFFC7_16545 [Candidatus Hermodarchaeota archaeon]
MVKTLVVGEGGQASGPPIPSLPRRPATTISTSEKGRNDLSPRFSHGPDLHEKIIPVYW